MQKKEENITSGLVTQEKRIKNKTIKMEINIKLNTDDLKNLVNEVTGGIKEDLEAAVEVSANYALDEIKKEAQNNLKDQYSFYEENLSMEKVNNVWVITLKSSAVFLEEGRDKQFMEYLLKGKDSAVIPFRHSSNAKKSSNPIKQEYSSSIQKLLRTQKIDMKQIEVGANGSPRIGVIKSFNVASSKPTKNASTPGLKGLSIVQQKNSDGSVSKELITFRTITKKHQSEGKWFSPKQEKLDAMGKAESKLLDFWNDEILPNILKKYGRV